MVDERRLEGVKRKNEKIKVSYLIDFPCCGQTPTALEEVVDFAAVEKRQNEETKKALLFVLSKWCGVLCTLCAAIGLDVCERWASE